MGGVASAVSIALWGHSPYSIAGFMILGQVLGFLWSEVQSWHRRDRMWEKLSRNVEQLWGRQGQGDGLPEKARSWLEKLVPRTALGPDGHLLPVRGADGQMLPDVGQRTRDMKNSLRESGPNIPLMWEPGWAGVLTFFPFLMPLVRRAHCGRRYVFSSTLKHLVKTTDELLL